MRRAFVMAAALGTAVTGGVLWWRDHRRFGAATVNRIVNPWLVREGVSDVTRGEIALLEHVGRVSGTVRVTPVHPVDTPEGVRIVMPLGSASQWGRNVVAAGHCRLQRGETVIELDTPRIVDPSAVEAIPRLAALGMSWLGFRYLLLRRFDEHEGTLEAPSVERRAVSTLATLGTEPRPEPTPVA
jgi:deazaflavin-dependent oxidoreductase (nitroreductase family)